MKESLGEALPLEIARVTEVLTHYHEVGLVGMFVAVMIEIYLKDAKEASASGDICRMINAYNNLKDIK